MNELVKFLIMRVMIVVVFALMSFVSNAQELALSRFVVNRLSESGESGNDAYEIQVALSELLHGTTIEVQVGLDSSCVGAFTDYFHIKKYANDYYLKYRGKRTLLEGKTIRCKIDSIDGLPWQNATFCLQGKSPNGKPSNTLHYTVEAH